MCLGGNQRDEVGAVARAGAIMRLRDHRPTSVPQDLGNCALDRTPDLVLSRSCNAVKELRRYFPLELSG